MLMKTDLVGSQLFNILRFGVINCNQIQLCLVMEYRIANQIVSRAYRMAFAVL